MTTLVSWIAYDQRGAASAYIATDSRVTWPARGSWDVARKCFASRCFPDVFGYAGDVLLPSLILGQFVDGMDAGSLPAGAALEVRRNELLTSLEKAVAAYPRSIPLQDFSVFHLGRFGNGMNSLFESAVIRCRSRVLSVDVQSSLDCSSVLELGVAGVMEANTPIVDGSGSSNFDGELTKWNSSSHAHTSRSAFSALCDSIATGEVESVGGPPQLVGLYRIGPGRIFGVATADGPSVLGRRLASRVRPNINLEWRNELFERVDETGDLAPGGKQHLDRAR